MDFSDCYLASGKQQGKVKKLATIVGFSLQPKEQRDDLSIAYRAVHFMKHHPSNSMYGH